MSHPLFSSIKNNALGLALFSIFTAGIITLTQIYTLPHIKNNILKAKTAALFEVAPKDSDTSNMLKYTIDLTQFNTQLLGPIDNKAIAYQIMDKYDKSINGVILPFIAPNGYTTHINLLIGISRTGKISGVRVLQHKETPGLGDKIEFKKSSWILSFNEKSLNSPTLNLWKVKKDGGYFDQFSGATITPRAIVNSVKKALLFFQRHQDALLNSSNPPEA
jgi:electron transport complex protein RnfG